MSTIGMVLTVILMILAVILAAIILMQSKRSAGLGAVAATAVILTGARTKGILWKAHWKDIQKSAAHCS